MFIIAELGINHSGDLKTALQMIKVAKECGADAVKFQKREITKVYTPAFLDAPRESPWGHTQRDQKQGLELSAEEYAQINMYCDEIGIKWFGSAWDLASLSFLSSYSPPYHKVASPMLTNLEFITEVAKLGKKTFIGTGMSDFYDIDKAVDIFYEHACPVVLMHCVSQYPCPDSLLNLRMITTLQDRYGNKPWVEIGYSGHEAGVMPSVAAILLGAKYVERHFTLDRTMYGSDQAASLEPKGLKRLVEYGRQAEEALGHGQKIITIGEQENSKKLRYWEAT